MKRGYIQRKTPLRAKPRKPPTLGALKASEGTTGAKKRKISRGSWVKKLDTVFSQWIRLTYADQNGNVKCYTCPKVLHWKSMQNGHYVSRSVRVSRWNPNNCRPQCYGCNCMHGGQPITFRENLIKELGLQEVEYIEASRWTIFKPEQALIDEQISLYEEKVEILINNL